MKLVFAHGWGSGPFVWKEMVDSFQDHEHSIINMGFLGEENLAVPEDKFIGIGHSLGGLWLLKHYPKQMAGFVSIASFNSFYDHIPSQILTAMKRNIIKDTSSQLKDFWHHAGLDQPNGFKNLKPVALLEGLGWLSQWKAEIPESLPLKILASHDDHIVPKKMTTDIWGKYPIDWINQGGHMLPITQPEWCSKHIQNFITQLEK
jgi:pimeloyl-[acyl-carrier protein] methyl ester esterase